MIQPPEFLIEIADFLNIIIINKYFIFINLWAIIHFLSGVLIMFLIIKFKLFKKKSFFLHKLSILFYLVILWEIVEFFLIKTGMFRTEITLDIIWDIIWGVLGGLFYLIFHKIVSKK